MQRGELIFAADERRVGADRRREHRRLRMRRSAVGETPQHFGVRRPCVRILLEEVGTQRAQVRRHGRIEIDWREQSPQRRLRDQFGVVGGERQLADERLIQHHAEAVPIGGAGHHVARRLLR